MAPDPNRTYHANQALELSELVNLQFSRVRYGIEDPRLVRMREPDGPSTDAGRKARQPLVLVREPDDESGIVFGFVDLFKRTADLRGFSLLRQQHEQRYGTPLPLTRSEYTRLLEELKSFLVSQAIETRILNSPRPASAVSTLTPASTARTPTTSLPMAPPPAATLVLAGAVGFVLCYLLVLLGVLPT